MRNLLIKLAVFGMGFALCFGTAACGVEDLIPPMPEEAMQKQLAAEKDEQITIENEEAESLKNISRQDEETSEKEEKEVVTEALSAETEISEVEVLVAPVTEVPWEDDIVTRYVASYVITDEETVELLKAQGEGDSAEYFLGTDFVIDVVLDLKEDGSASMYYDFERWINIMEANLNKNFDDLILAKYEEEGVSREELEKQMRARGFRNLEDALGVAKRTFMRRVDPALRECFQEIENIRINMTWTQEGDTLSLDGLGDLQIKGNGSFDYTLPADQSVGGNPYELHFIPVTKSF